MISEDVACQPANASRFLNHISAFRRSLEHPAFPDALLWNAA
jgi:hypothetical protein